MDTWVWMENVDYIEPLNSIDTVKVKFRNKREGWDVAWTKTKEEYYSPSLDGQNPKLE